MQKEMEKKNTNVIKPISLGPWGGNGGSKWTHNKDGYCILAGMIICYGKRIDSIVLKCVDDDENTIYTKEFGCSYGVHHTEKIAFEYHHECVKSISGYYGQLETNDPVTIRSLTIITNLRKYGPIGPEEGTYFDLRMEDGMIVGFHGRSGAFLDSVGVYVMPIISDPKGKSFSRQTYAPRITSGRELIAAPELGPWGAAGGRPFEDGAFSGIRKVVVQRDKRVFHSMFIEYDRSGKSVFKKHGGDGGDIVDAVCLDYPKECLISISGFYGAFDGHEVLKSLSFTTSKANYGPFGSEIGLFFSSGEVDAKIVGFHGRSGTYLNAIGVVREYIERTIHN